MTDTNAQGKDLPGLIGPPGNTGEPEGRDAPPPERFLGSDPQDPRSHRLTPDYLKQVLRELASDNDAGATDVELHIVALEAELADLRGSSQAGSATPSDAALRADAEDTIARLGTLTRTDRERRYAQEIVALFDRLARGALGSEAGSAPADPLRKYATNPDWLDSANQAMQALYGAAAGHPNQELIERNVKRIHDALRGAGSAGITEPSEAALEAAETAAWGNASHRSGMDVAVPDIEAGVRAAYAVDRGAASPSSAPLLRETAPIPEAALDAGYWALIDDLKDTGILRPEQDGDSDAIFTAFRAAATKVVLAASPSSGEPPTDTEIYTKLAEDYAGALREIAALEERVREWREAEQSLSDAYVRLRSKLAPWGAWKTPHAPTREQVWQTTERALDALMLDLEKALGGSSGEGRAPE